MALRVNVQEHRPMHFVVQLEGRLDTETHAQLQQAVNMLFETPVRGVQLDLAGLDYISSMGLRAVMMAARQAAAQKAAFGMLRPQPPVRAILDMAKVLPSQSIFASVDEADRYFDMIQKAEQAKQTKP